MNKVHHHHHHHNHHVLLCFCKAEQITSHCSIVPFLYLQSKDQRNQEETAEDIMLFILEFIDESGLSETTRFQGLHGQGDGEILVFF